MANLNLLPSSHKCDSIHNGHHSLFDNLEVKQGMLTVLRCISTIERDVGQDHVTVHVVQVCIYYGSLFSKQ